MKGKKTGHTPENNSAMVPKCFYVTATHDEIIKKLLATGKYVSQSEIFRDGILKTARDAGVSC